MIRIPNASNNRFYRWGAIYPYYSSVPIAIGSMPTARVQENTGSVTIPTASYWNVGAGTYSLDTSLTGVTINSTSGVVSINTATVGRRFNTNVTVRKTSSGGFSTQTFPLIVGPQIGFSIPYAQLDPLSGTQRTDWFNSARAKGATWVRIDFETEWAWFGAVSPGGTYYTIPDDFVTRANAAGLKVMFILKGSPEWARPGGGSSISYPSAAQRAAYATRAQEVANRYNGTTNPTMRVDAWELWNEPNLPGFSQTPSASEYATFANAMRAAILTGHPGAQVLVGATSPAEDTASAPILGAPEFFVGMYAGGITGHTALSHHPYSTPENPSGTSGWNGWHMMEATLRATAVANGDTAKQFWVTEYGAPIGGNSGLAAVTEAQQSAMLVEAFDIGAQTSWIGPIMYYSLRHKGLGAPIGTGSTEDWFGIERNDGTNPTLAAAALTNIRYGA